MATTLFPTLTPPAGEDLQQKAWAKWQAAPLLSRAEHWRWTDFKALKDPTRRIELADYQYDIPEDFGDDFGINTTRDQALLTIPTGIFAALNLAHLPDAFLLTVPENKAFSEIASLNVDMFAEKIQFSRIHIKAEKNSKSAFWLEYNADKNGAQIPVLTVEAEEGAEIDIALWFAGAENTAQVMQMQIEEAENAIVRVNALENHGALQRFDIETNLHGNCAHFAFGGVQCLHGKDVGDYHITINHQTENSTSEQILRGTLADHSHGIFYGMIHVDKGAFETNAEQDCRYILLSDQAKASSMPCLLINTAEVKCAHGATAGELNEESLFYLRSRGIPVEIAQKMLILSFLLEAVILSHPALKKATHEAISQLWQAESEEVSC